METITVKSTATNSELLKLVQSLTINKVDFDSLNREESNDVLYIVNQAYRTISLEVENLRIRLSNSDYSAEDIRRWIQSGEFDFTMNLTTTRNNSPANFGYYMVKLRE